MIDSVKYMHLAAVVRDEIARLRGSDQNRLEKLAQELSARRLAWYSENQSLLKTDKEWDKIISYWNIFLEIEPGHAEAYLERSGTYYHKRDFARFLKDLKQACDLGSKEGCKRYQQDRENRP